MLCLRAAYASRFHSPLLQSRQSTLSTTESNPNGPEMTSYSKRCPAIITWYFTCKTALYRVMHAISCRPQWALKRLSLCLCHCSGKELFLEMYDPKSFSARYFGHFLQFVKNESSFIDDSIESREHIQKSLMVHCIHTMKSSGKGCTRQ